MNLNTKDETKLKEKTILDCVDFDEGENVTKNQIEMRNFEEIIYSTKMGCEYWLEKAIGYNEVSKYAIEHCADKSNSDKEFMNLPASEKMKIEAKYFPDVYPVAIFLQSFAIETLIKGLIMLKGKYDPNTFFTHNLCGLLKGTGLSLSKYQQELKGAGEAIIWKAKYPIPKKRGAAVMNQNSELPCYETLFEIYKIIFNEICENDGGLDHLKNYE